jgi:hexosaminidase
VAYARERFIAIVPEIDLPSHINAALSSYPELNCDGKAPPLYTGIEVGFSVICVDKDVTYKFIDDVVREIAGLTPTPWFHLGGDEVKKLTDEQYARFIERVQAIVVAHGKTVVGWDEIAASTLVPGAIVQHWRPKNVPSLAVSKGAKVILSPANRIYLDMKYHDRTVLGLKWAGLVDVPDAYSWEPLTMFQGLPEASILGVETAIWSETLATLRDFEFMAFPRLPGAAEIAWSRADGRGWDEYRLRLAGQEPRWSAIGINFYRSPTVPWAR